jgi:hypothetical protein
MARGLPRGAACLQGSRVPPRSRGGSDPDDRGLRGLQGPETQRVLRLKARRGPNKAVLAVAATLLTAAYHMLKYGVEYRDLGPNHFDRDKELQATRLIRRLKALGVQVTVTPAA